MKKVVKQKIKKGVCTLQRLLYVTKSVVYENGPGSNKKQTNCIFSGCG